MSRPFRFNTFDYLFVLLLALIMFLPLALTMFLTSYLRQCAFSARLFTNSFNPLVC